VGPYELVQAAAIARRYFIDGQSKVDIAKDFNLSRFKVARLIDACLEQGIVHIEIRLPAELDAELSEALKQAFRLQHALVINTPGDSEPALRRNLGRAAADLITHLVTESDVLGIGWGRTLNEMADFLTGLPPCPVVQMTGVVGDVSSNSVELVRRVTVASGGQAYPIYAPLVVSDPGTADALRKEPALAQAIERFETITVAAIAVGSWDPPNSQLYDSLSAGERDELRQAGVVGEICSTLLDADGEVVGDFGRRSIAVPSAQLREIPTTVVVAGGRSKAVAIRAVLNGGFATALVTDSEVARELLGRT